MVHLSVYILITHGNLRVGSMSTSSCIFNRKNGISIADIQTKVVKEVTVSPISMCGNAWLIGIILITPNLLTLSIWIQITIHPLAIAGAIVI